MQDIDAILFDPVGSLAEFPSEPFVDIATKVFGRALAPGISGSRAYWEVVNLLEAADQPLRADERATVEGCEREAVARTCAYEDCAPALAELVNLGVRLIAATSLSEAALTGFLEQSFLSG